jgi:hypothetical protein
MHVCTSYHGEKGHFAYRAFEWTNRAVFGGSLPVPLIQFALIAYGHSCAKTHPRPPEQPVITIHPSLWTGPGWDGLIPGPGEVLDAIIHELLHVYVHYVHLPGLPKRSRSRSKDSFRWSSHDNKTWAELVEQFSPRVPGLELGVRASHRRSARVDGEVRKITPPDCISLDQLARWPSSLRPHGSTQYWKKHGVPFGCRSTLDAT